MPVRECPGVEPQPDGMCRACGNRVAQYTRRGRLQWEHKRGLVAGSPCSSSSAASSWTTRSDWRASASRVANLAATPAWAAFGFHERDVMTMLARIEAKLDKLLARPAGYVESHRRQADGGRSVREQRAEAGLPKRSRKRRGDDERSPGAIRQANWRQQRLERPKPVPA